MMANVLAKVRAFLIRGLAVVAVLATYSLSTVGTQVASVVGVSSLVMTTTATPAQAQRWWRRRWRRRYRRRWW